MMLSIVCQKQGAGFFFKKERVLDNANVVRNKQYKCRRGAYIFELNMERGQELFDDRHANSYHPSQQAGRPIASKGQSKRFYPFYSLKQHYSTDM
jgi:hypothetical protein